METVTSGLTTGIANAATDMMGAIGDILPVALPVMAAIAVIGVGIKVFRKVTGRSS